MMKRRSRPRPIPAQRRMLGRNGGNHSANKPNARSHR